MGLTSTRARSFVASRGPVRRGCVRVSAAAARCQGYLPFVRPHRRVVHARQRAQFCTVRCPHCCCCCCTAPPAPLHASWCVCGAGSYQAMCSNAAGRRRGPTFSTPRARPLPPRACLRAHIPACRCARCTEAAACACGVCWCCVPKRALTAAATAGAAAWIQRARRATAPTSIWRALTKSGAYASHAMVPPTRPACHHPCTTQPAAVCCRECVGCGGRRGRNAARCRRTWCTSTGSEAPLPVVVVAASRGPTIKYAHQRAASDALPLLPQPPHYCHTTHSLS